MTSIRTALLVVVVLAMVGSLAGTPAEAAAATHRPVPFQRGVTIAEWGGNGYGSSGYGKLVNSLKARGVDTVTLVVVWRQDGPQSVTITPDSLTVTTAHLVNAIKTAHSAGLRVILKPYIAVRTDTWRGQIAPSSVSQWFASYDAFIVRYAKLAQNHHVQGFVVGTEMNSMQRYAARWQALIGQVRQAFRTGFVTYQANHGDENVTWWDAVDVIDISAYYPLSSSGAYDVPDLIRGWSNPYHVLASLHRRYHRDVMFGELGYTPYTRTFAEPWVNTPLGTYSTTAQANGYRAAFSVWYPAAFFKGFEWWYVSSGATLTTHEPRPGALRVMRSWYLNKQPAGA